MEHTLNAGKVDTINHEIASIDESLERLPDDEGNSQLTKIDKNHNEKKDLLEKQLIALEINDWQAFLQHQNKIDISTIEGRNSGNLIGGEPIESIENRLMLNQELLDCNIPPSDPNYATDGFHSLKNVLEIFMSFIGILIFLILLGDLFSNEFEVGTSKFLFAQPIYRTNVMGAKFLIALISIVIILLTVSIFSFIVGSIFSGTGNYNYPVMIQSSSGESFMDLWLFLIVCSLLFVFVIAFVMILQFFFSIITRSNLLSIGITIILSAIFHMSIVHYNFFKGIAHIVPFSYLDPFSIVDGTLPSQLDNGKVSIQVGIGSLIVFGTLLYIVSGIILRKREV